MIKQYIRRKATLHGFAVQMRRRAAHATRQIGKLRPSKLIESYQGLKNSVVFAHWWSDQPNWGDALNPVLIGALSRRRVVNARETLVVGQLPTFAVIGSILHAVAGRHVEVWGAGFLYKGAQMRVKPRKVWAVRGPLTRQELLKQGIDCPDVYGDPALLFPRFYTPATEKRYKLGVIPHFKDKGIACVAKLGRDPDVLIIDILGSVREVVDQINSCECIASSSLHGLIAADAYGVPAVWIELSDRVEGNGFKFHDYYKSIGHQQVMPIRVSNETTARTLMRSIPRYDVDIDLDRLLAACPFSGN